MKIEALRVLADEIEERIPALAGAICPWPALPNHKQKFPSLAIIPIAWKWYVDQAEEEQGTDIDPVTAVMNVGYHEVMLQLRLVHATPVQRAAIEEDILDLFLETVDHPGVLLTSATTDRKGTFPCSWELDDEEWNDEMAFDQKFETTLNVLGQIPALVQRRQAPRIRKLLLAMVPWGGKRSDAGTVTVQINKDGSVTQVQV